MYNSVRGIETEHVIGLIHLLGTLIFENKCRAYSCRPIHAKQSSARVFANFKLSYIIYHYCIEYVLVSSTYRSPSYII